MKLELIGGVAIALLVGCGGDDDLDPPRLMDPTTIPKFDQPLLIIPAMPAARATPAGAEYEVAVRQFRQQVLPPPLPPSLVWGYGRDGDPLPGTGPASTFNTPGFTFETRSNVPVRVTWTNQLVDESGRFLPHLFPVDSTIHWADPGGDDHSHDHGAQPAQYKGPVPMVVHVHGAHSFDHSDGYPEAWYLPAATDIPSSLATRGPQYKTQVDVGEGAAVFDYPQDENAATLWYHDHTLGMTRLNIYAGLAGFWLIRDEIEDAMNLPGPAPRAGDPEGTQYYEIPIVIADRNFTTDGQVSYPTGRAQFDGYSGPFIPDSDVPPIWGPEFIGNTMIANGRVWPFLEVEPRLYRFRFLNASDARTLMLAFDRAGLEFIQIGVDGGFLPNAPVRQQELLMGSSERVDVLVDFSGIAVGESVTLVNRGPDEPWGGPDAGQDPADPETTGQVMQFRVVPLTDAGVRGAIPTTLPAIATREPTVPARDLMLAEQDTPDNFPTHVLLGTVALGPLPWAAETTEVMKLDSTEIWRIANTTDDAHPIHLHLVEFQILDRLPFDVDRFSDAQAAWLAGTGPQPSLDAFVTGPAIPPSTLEGGSKDTVLTLPGTITRIISRFDREGLYVWHCHIIEHEDNDMMRPMQIIR